MKRVNVSTTAAATNDDPTDKRSSSMDDGAGSQGIVALTFEGDHSLLLLKHKLYGLFDISLKVWWWWLLLCGGCCVVVVVW